MNNMGVATASEAKTGKEFLENTVSRSLSSPSLGEQIKRHVTSGTFMPGDRYLTVRELARRFRVSPVTVNRTIRGLADEGVLEIRGNAGTFVGVAVRPAAAALQVVHVIAPDLPSQRERLFKQGLAEGLLSAMPGVSMQLHLLPAIDPGGYLNAVYSESSALSNMVGAVLLRVPRVVREFFFSRRLSAVVFGNVEDHLDLPCVDRDQRAIGESITKFLLAKGHQRLGLVMMDAWNPGDNLLIQGVHDALSSESIPNTALAVQSVPEEVPMIDSLIRQWTARDDRPTALICRTDAIAVEALAMLERVGLSVPQDMAVVSLGNDSAMLQQVRPTITAMTNDHEARGRLAGELLMAAYRGQEPANRRLISQATLVEREST